MVITLDIPDEQVPGVLKALEVACQHLSCFPWDELSCRRGKVLGALRDKIRVHSLLQSKGQLDTTEVHTVGDIHLLLETVIAIAQTRLADPPTSASQAFWDHLVNWIENELLNVEVYETWLSGKVS